MIKFHQEFKCNTNQRKHTIFTACHEFEKFWKVTNHVTISLKTILPS